MLRRRFFTLPTFVCFCFALTVSAQVKQTEIWTSLPPLAWLTSQIAGDTILVKALLQPGQDPHTYSPRPKELATVKNASFFLHCGTDFERMLAQKIHAMSPGMTVENIWEDDKQANKDTPPAGHTHHKHDHDGHGHDCSAHEGDKDPHVWMSPVNLIQMADTITDLLSTQLPDQQAVFAANLTALTEVLKNADKEFARQLSPIKGSTFYVHHPAFGHFAARYHLTQKAVEVEGKNPTPKQLLALIESARKEAVKTIVTSPQFSDRSSEILARKIGGTVVKVDPLNPNPLTAMRQLTDALLGTKSTNP